MATTWAALSARNILYLKLEFSREIFRLRETANHRIIHLHNLEVWFLSLTYYCTPGFYCSPILVKGVHLALLRYNTIKSPFPVYFFWSQWGTQQYSPGGKLKARPYTCFRCVNLLQYHWFQWHNMWLHLEKAIFGGANPSPHIAGNRESVLRKYSCAFPLFYTLLQPSATDHCLRQGTRLDGSSVCRPKVILMFFCRAKISRSTPSLLI